MALLRNIFVQLIVFIVIFQLLSWFREMSMLPTNEQLTTAPVQYNTLAGETMTIEAQGKKTVVYFFAPWCKICHASIGNLQSIYQKSMDMEVIAVALDYASKREVEEFTSKHMLTFPVVLGSEALKKEFQIKGYPSYYVLGEDNEVESRSMGYSSEIGLYLRTL